MKKIMRYILVFIGFLLMSSLSIAQTKPLPNGVLKKTWENGVVKEVAEWKNGFISGTRKFYSKEGKLDEEHFFSDSIYVDKYNKSYGIGKIFTYHENGNKASVVPVVQAYDKNGDYVIYGYDIINGYDDEGVRLFSIDIADSITLNHWNNKYYEKYNHVYLDALLLVKDIQNFEIRGDMKFYYRNGAVSAQGKIFEGMKHGIWEHYYPSGQLESKGYYIKLPKNLNISRKGGWVSYYENGKLKAEVDYFENDNSEKGIAKYYDDQGKLIRLMEFPKPGDAFKRIDTVELYYPDYKLQFSYTESNKAKRFNPIKNELMDYPYSGLQKEYYPNGNLKSYGYISKTPRGKVHPDDLLGDPCITKNYKKIGTWYTFDEAGEMTSIVVYFMCGTVKSTLPPKEVLKESKIYQKSPENYPFVNKL